MPSHKLTHVFKQVVPQCPTLRGRFRQMEDAGVVLASEW